MEEIDLVLSGSGTLLVCHLGALDRLSREYKISRIAGTSGGGLVAAGYASGMTISEMLGLCRDFLDGSLLKKRIPPFWGWGIYRTAPLRALIRQYLPGTIGDAKIPFGVLTTDLETKNTVFMNRLSHGNIPLEYAVMATACIPIMFPPLRIPNLKGLWVDGGISANYAEAVWDDLPGRRTVGVRFHGTHKRKPVRTTVDWMGSLMGVLMDNRNHTYTSSKDQKDAVEIASRGDGMSFSLTDEQIRVRYQEGWIAADRFIRRQNVSGQH